MGKYYPGEPADYNFRQIFESLSGASSSGVSRIVGAPKLRKLLSALGQASYRRVNIGLHSHSIGVGVDATSAGTYGATQFSDWHTQSWAAITAKILSAATGGFGSSAGLCVGGTGNTYNPLLTLGGGAATPTPDALFGPAFWRATMTAPAHTYSFKAVGAYVRVYAVLSGTDLAGAGVQPRWSAPSVSAGATQVIAAPTAALGAALTPAGNRTFYEFTVGPVVPGETVTFIGPTASSWSFYYLDLDYRPSAAGVTIHRLCQPGASLASIHNSALDNTDTLGPNSGSANATQRLGQAQSMSTRLPLDGVILQSDVNDLNEFGVWGYTLADMKRHLANYLAYHASLGLPALVICGPIRDPAFNVGSRPYNQDNLVAAYAEAVAAAPNAAFLDLTKEWAGSTITERYDAQVASGVMQDNVHWNRTGHGSAGMQIGEALLQAAYSGRG